MTRRVPLMLSTAIALALPANAWAQDDDEDPEDYTEAYVQTTDSLARDELDYRLQPLGFELMGDSIDEFTGALALSVTDVAIPGNSNLEVAFRRVARSREETQRSSDIADRQQISLGDWEIDVPYISSQIGESGPPRNLQTANYEWENDSRCDDLPAAREGYHAAIFNGVNLNIPGSGAGKVLEPNRVWSPSANNAVSPVDGAPLPVIGITKDHTVVGCIAEIGTANGGGEGFVAVTPDGTQYRMDRVVKTPLHYQDADISRFDTVRIEREEMRLVATEATDVHGNWVKYDYTTDGKLTKIHSNDGRQIDISYLAGTKNVSSVTANGRTWTYSYSGGLLNRVTLPDGRYWTYNLGAWSNREPSTCEVIVSVANPWAWGQASCLNDDTSTSTISITHPYGMQASFDVKRTVHGYTEIVRPFGYGHEQVIKPEKNLAILKKTLSGSGVPTSTWQYDYENVLNISDIPFNDFNNTYTKTTSYTAPDGTYKETDFFIGGYKRSKRAAVRNYASNGGALLEEMTFDYVVTAGGNELGNLESFDSSIYEASTKGAAYVSDVTTQRGSDTYTVANTYDIDLTSAGYSFGLPLTIASSSNASSTVRTQDITYQHLKNKWIIGLPDRVTRNGKLFDDLNYDAFGRVTWHNQFGVRRGTFTYHTSGVQAGMMATSKDALNRTITYNSWVRGVATDVTRPDGKHLLRTVDSNGWTTSQSDAKGNTTGYQYNNVGWITKIDRPAPWADTNLSYHNIGSSSFYQIANQGTKQGVIWYDMLHRPWRERTRALSGGGVQSYTKTVYDEMGREIFTSFPSASSNPSQGVETTYDGLGRTLTTGENVGPFATTSYEYLSGNRTRVTDPSGNQTTTTLRSYGSPRSGDVIQIAEPLGKFTDMTYDVYGNILTATQRGNQNGFNVTNTQNFYYDSRLRLCRHSQLESGDTLYRYNNANELTIYAEGQAAGTACSTPPTNVRTINTYDNLGRITRVNYASGTPDIVIGYDDNGNVTSKVRGTTNWSYAYDNGNNLTSETLTIDGRTYNNAYEYNSIGALTYQTFPTGMRVEFAPNGLGQATKARKVASTNYGRGITYHRNGAVNRIIYGNNFQHTSTYNDRQLMDTMLVEKNGVKAVDLAYEYDANARITSITDAAPTQTALSNPISGIYTYDALDNIRSRQVGGQTVTLDYNSTKRLSRVRDSADGNVWRNYSYDARGSVTNNGKFSFVYDLANQPTSMSGSGVSGSFVYDGNLKRAKQILGGDTIYSVYSASGALVHRDNASANEKTDYVRAAGKTIARVENGIPTYSHTNHLGSAVTATTSTGTIAWQENYLPYGTKRINPLGNRDKAGFTGHIDDAATGLTYMQARYYDPNIGRFLSKDPVDFKTKGNQHFSRYQYASNNPTNRIDPDGRRDIYIGGASDNNTRIVADYAAEQQRLNPDRDIQYFDYGDNTEIYQAAVAAREAGEPLNIVGHSLGGRGAVNLAQSLADAGVQIDNLITIDPVGATGKKYWGSNTDNWLNVQAVPSAENRQFISDTIAADGGRMTLGTTDTGAANQNVTIDASHGWFRTMLTGSGGDDLIDQSYEKDEDGHEVTP